MPGARIWSGWWGERGAAGSARRDGGDTCWCVAFWAAPIARDIGLPPVLSQVSRIHIQLNLRRLGVRPI